MAIDSVEHNLKHKVAKGLFWGGMSNMLCLFLSILFSVFLARILGPEDYGPIGMLAIFTAIATSLQDSGFIAAIANRKEVTHDDYNAVFWFNILVSLLMYACLYVCAPSIASFFNQPVLVELSRYNFLSIVVAAFGIAPSAYLFRELKVKQRSISFILAILVSGIVSVVMALEGYSYWGIATQSIVYMLVRTTVCWYFTPWRPGFKVNFAPLKYLFAFSYRLLITNIFQRFNWNIFSFILGKYYSRAEVGNYTKSAEWFNMGSEIANGMVNAVAQPALAKVADDSERQKRLFCKMLRFTAFVSFPLMFCLALVAKPLIAVVVSDEWLESASMLQLLAVWGAFMPLQSMFTNLLVSRSRTRAFMWCTIVQGLLTLSILLSVHSQGIRFMLVAYCVFNTLWLFVWYGFANKELPIKLSDCIGGVLPYAVLALATVVVVRISTGSIVNLPLLLAVRVLLTAVIYLAVAYVMRSKELREIIDFLFKRKKVC